jgi:UDP-N-acetylmuramate-alanine ligase
MKMPKTIGLVHFIGIGGIGMSGIAEVLHNLGHRVQGSDQADSANVQRLREKGISVSIGHKAENLGDAEVVVVSTAIKKDNPELIAAREKFLPVVRRAEMLAELMRFRNAIAIGGTHGKTTTTSMVAALLDAGGLDPTVINGGIINAYGTNARMGAGEWMVVEADESDGTFLKLPADIAVVTNIDPEHLDHYRARGLPAVRRERALLRFWRAVSRPPGGPVHGRQDRGPEGRHLRREPPGRRALPQYPHGRCDLHLRYRDPPPPHGPGDRDQGPQAADARTP